MLTAKSAHTAFTLDVDFVAETVTVRASGKVPGVRQPYDVTIARRPILDGTPSRASIRDVEPHIMFRQSPMDWSALIGVLGGAGTPLHCCTFLPSVALSHQCGL